MMTVISCVTTMHSPWLVLLAAVVCLSGGWVTFELHRRARQRSGFQRSGWVFLAAVAGGSSVWCTHFIAILAYDAGVPVTFDPILTFASLAAVIAGASLALRISLSPSMPIVALAGAMLGLSIAAMHYLGMLAFRVDGIVAWDTTYVVASLALAVAFSAASLVFAAKARRIAALASFVLAVVGLHFTAMTAVSVTPLLTGLPLADPATISAMAVAVAGVALLIVGTGVASYMIDTDVSESNLDVLRRMAHFDALTGLPNRVSHLTRLRRELERTRSAGHRLAVIGIDLDKFKEINDLRGHEAGDQALISIAGRLSAAVTDGEFVARIGGDEFAALKPFREQSELSEFLARLENVFKTPITIGDLDIASGASIGVSVGPSDGDEPERLISNADLAMYRAKTDISSSVCFYEAEMDERARARRELSLDLRKALELGQFELHYQVQKSVGDPDTTVGYEVLLRWKHPKRGFVSPAEFIPLAEETGLILSIGEWVLREACREASNWPGGEKIAVNLSPVQLGYGDLPRLVHAVLLETGLSPARLELEITESAIIEDKARSLHALRMIRALGVTVALDDFGTGYSSLDTLRSFPFDRIKLDRSFMGEVGDSAQARAIIRAVLALGKSLEIRVLAEGVETAAQLLLLKAEGCDEAQGYFLGRPRPRPSGQRVELTAA